ncbi:MAG TPA: [protein-PII] uridylyltransferase, partial [Candidatus Binatia bacterium]|nr:[protein-PII] uridylyltransferase [Candidatus Binatia bacterium]
RVLAGEVDVEELVRRSRRPSILARRKRRVQTVVEIDNRVSRGYTVLDVYTGDRVGVLFTITNCLYHLWLEIHVAKITTMVDQVLDVFYVTDNEGRKIEDSARLEVIRRELTRALETEDAPAAVAAGAAGA